MKTRLLILLTVLTTSGFTQDNSYCPKYSTILDQSKGELLLKQCSRRTPKNVSDFWTPTNNDIQIIERNFKKVTRLKTANGQTIKILDKFAFQYIGVIIKKKKLIYINAFHLDNDNEFTKWGLIGIRTWG